MKDLSYLSGTCISKEKVAKICIYYAKSEATMGEVADELEVGRNTVLNSILRCLYYELVPKKYIDIAIAKEMKNVRGVSRKSSIDEKVTTLENLRDEKKALIKKRKDCLLIREKLGSTTLYKDKISSIEESLENIEKKAISLMR